MTSYIHPIRSSSVCESNQPIYSHKKKASLYQNFKPKQSLIVVRKSSHKKRAKSSFLEGSKDRGEKGISKVVGGSSHKKYNSVGLGGNAVVERKNEQKNHSKRKSMFGTQLPQPLYHHNNSTLVHPSSLSSNHHYYHPSNQHSINHSHFHHHPRVYSSFINQKSSFIQKQPSSHRNSQKPNKKMIKKNYQNKVNNSISRQFGHPSGEQQMECCRCFCSDLKNAGGKIKNKSTGREERWGSCCKNVQGIVNCENDGVFMDRSSIERKQDNIKTDFEEKVSIKGKQNGLSPKEVEQMFNPTISPQTLQQNLHNIDQLTSKKLSQLQSRSQTIDLLRLTINTKLSHPNFSQSPQQLHPMFASSESQATGPRQQYIEEIIKLKELESNFYVDKITEFQSELNKCRKEGEKREQGIRAICEEERRKGSMERLRLEEENALLKRENDALRAIILKKINSKKV